ncbi:MAG: hypothetical protein ACJ754_25915, partial [Pyrinomonadaceae bacterium]
MIAAIVLPLLALIFVYNMLSGPSHPAPATTNANTKGKAGARPSTAQQTAPGTTAAADLELSAADVSIINCCPEPYSGGDAGRNIFAFYVKPTPPPTPEPNVPTPTPTPPPDKMLAGLTPQSVFA